MARNWPPGLWENPHNQHTAEPHSRCSNWWENESLSPEEGWRRTKGERGIQFPASPLLPEPPPVKLVSELTPLTVHEGDDATFQCEVSPPDAEVTWLRNGAIVTPGPQLDMVHSGSSRTLIIRGCQLKDAGTVTARAGATDTSARLHVRGLVRPSIKCSVPCNPLTTVA